MSSPKRLLRGRVEAAFESVPQAFPCQCHAQKREGILFTRIPSWSHRFVRASDQIFISRFFLAKNRSPERPEPNKSNVLASGTTGDTPCTSRTRSW